MKAIDTKFIGPSNTKGSRYIARDSDGNRVIVKTNFSLNADQNHARAAAALRDKIGWKGEMVGGATKTGMCFVFVSDVRIPA